MTKKAVSKKYKRGGAEEDKKKGEDKIDEEKKKIEYEMRKRYEEKKKLEDSVKKNKDINQYLPNPLQKIDDKNAFDIQKMLPMGPYGISSSRNISSSSTSATNAPDKKKTPYEKIKEAIEFIIQTFKQFVDKNANTYSISDFIELNPTKTRLVNGQKVVQNMTPLKKGSFTYIILYIAMLLIFSIIPAVIIGLTLYYFFGLMNITKWFRKKMFYGDNVSYQNLDKIVNVFRRFYINDYTFYMMIICLVYIIALIYIFFSSYVKITNPQYRTYSFSVYSLVSLCVGVIVIHLAVYYNFIQIVGRLRDKINNTVYNHINLDYIDFLTNLDKNNSKCKEECEMKVPGGNTIKLCSCDPSILEINSIDNLQSYIRGLLDEVESKVSPTDISMVSAETFKTYKNEKGESYYDVILDSVMTFSLLLNFSNTKYDININRAFLENRTSVIATINESTNILYDFHPMKCGTDGVSQMKCLNRDMDGQNNNSKYMTKICEDVQNLVQDVRDDIGKLKNKMGFLTVSLQFFAIILTLIVCIIYYASFVY